MNRLNIEYKNPSNRLKTSDIIASHSLIFIRNTTELNLFYNYLYLY